METILTDQKKATLSSIAVFCGSSGGNDPSFGAAAYETGAVIARSGLRLIYGGARVGLMGRVADGALEAGGEVIGVLPGFLQTKEIMHEGLTQLIVVDTMHQRKLKMHELSDGIVTLPGGFGTFEELFEMLTWGQLGLHRKPAGLLNIHGFYDPLVAQLALMTSAGFLSDTDRMRLLVADNPEALLDKMHSYEPPAAPKWISEKTT